MISNWVLVQTQLTFKTPEQSAAMGVDTRMPTSLGESIEALKKAIGERKLLPMGENFLTGFLAHKTAEESVFGKMPDLERRLLFTKLW